MPIILPLFLYLAYHALCVHEEKRPKKDMFRSKRWKRNRLQMHDRASVYPWPRFAERQELSKATWTGKAARPSEALEHFLGSRNAALLLDPVYRAEQCQTLFELVKGVTPDFQRAEQVVFTGRILLYLIFMSEDDVLARYLRYWRWKEPSASLRIEPDWITDTLTPGCSCRGCFDVCVRIARRFLPEVINNAELRGVQ